MESLSQRYVECLSVFERQVGGGSEIRLSQGALLGVDHHE